MDTLARAKEDIRQGWKTPNGATCPCCGQNVKLYERSIYKSMVCDLIGLYHMNKNNTDFHHRRDFGTPLVGGGDFAKLRFWGLIEEKINEDTGKRSSGSWRITEQGRLYVENQVKLSKYALTYNNKLFGFDGPLLGISDTKWKDFNYAELMGFLL